MSDKVDIRQIKDFALTIEEPLKSLILSEPDSLEREDYLSKSETWLRILQIKETR